MGNANSPDSVWCKISTNGTVTEAFCWSVAGLFFILRFTKMNRTSRVKQRTLRIANLKFHEIRRHPGFNNRRGREDGVGMGGLAEVS